MPNIGNLQIRSIPPKIQEYFNAPFNEHTTASKVIPYLQHAPYKIDPNWTNVQTAYRQMLRDTADKIKETVAPKLSSTGIVTTAGGPYFDSGWVTIAILRRILNCKLPIEVWHLGAEEMKPWMRQALKAFDNVTAVDAIEVAKRQGYRLTPKGYAIKSLAILHSNFRHVYFSDPDAYPLVDPAELFASKKYQSSGAVFTKDQGRFDLTSKQCGIVGIPYQCQEGFETGQILIDKQRSWKELNLWRWLDDNSDYYYKHGLGDCLTAKMAFRYWANTHFEFADKDRWIWLPPSVIHKFDGKFTFVHRINRKLTLEDNSKGNEVFATTGQKPPEEARNDNIPLESMAWGFLEELRKIKDNFKDNEECQCGRKRT